MKVINPNSLPTISISKVSTIQGDLKFLSKDNYKKLKSSIERTGFYIPIYVWTDEKGTKWLLDGNQRKHVLETEGWLDPVPYLEVKADSRAKAAELLLEITSQFGTITQEGLDEFIAKFQLPEMDILAHTNFDGIFNFNIEPPEVEPEPETEAPEPEGMSLRINIVDNGEHFVVKTAEKKKTNTVGKFTQWQEAMQATVEFLEEYKPE